MPWPELLADHTTLRLGGPATRLGACDDRGRADRRRPRLRRGGRAGAGPGRRQQPRRRRRGLRRTVVESRRHGIVPTTTSARVRRRLVTVAAGEALGRRGGARGRPRLGGIEALSGIPGSSGATPSRTSAPTARRCRRPSPRVRVWDRGRGAGPHARRRRLRLRLPHSAASRPTRGRARGPATSTFQLRPGELCAPVAYAELARTLGVEVGARAPMADVRDTVLALRARQGHGARPRRPRHVERGLVLHQPGPDAGEAAVPDDAPRVPEPDGRVKTSAAWLIERAGFSQGFGAPGPARSRPSTRSP